MALNNVGSTATNYLLVEERTLHEPCFAFSTSGDLLRVIYLDPLISRGENLTLTLFRIFNFRRSSPRHLFGPFSCQMTTET
jgi:hypothetical protein